MPPHIMFAWLKSKLSTPAHAPAQVHARISDGHIVYAIGDLHGMANLTATMIDRLLCDARQFEGKRPHLVFLGDYVDKGDHSKNVIDLLIAASRNTDVDWTFIKGNHEDALLAFLENPLFGPQWLAYGGGPTLQSYGVSIPSGQISPERWGEIAAQFGDALPAAHLEFFQSLPTSLLLGGYFFAHAGIRPGRSLEEQEDGDLMWIRRQFLDDRRALPAIVVHGHSPDLEPYRDHRRIGVDTGAYATGRLSAVRLVASTIELMSVTRADIPHDGLKRHDANA